MSARPLILFVIFSLLTVSVCSAVAIERGDGRASIIKRPTPPLKFSQMLQCIDLEEACWAKCETLYGPVAGRLNIPTRDDEDVANLSGHLRCLRDCGRASVPGNNCIKDCEYQDREPPNLKIVWTPPSGTTVKPGEKITVKVTARDDANAWQSGVQTIWLEVEGILYYDSAAPTANNPGSGSSTFRYVGDPTAYPQPDMVGYCNRRHETRTFERTYTVTDNPPPIVRLKAMAKDFDRNIGFNLGEFPVQPDWSGRFEWTHSCQGRASDVTKGIGDVALYHDGQGNLTGTLVGGTPERAQTITPCTMTYVAPGTFSAKLKGSYTPGTQTFSAQAFDGQTTPGRGSFACPYATTVNDLNFYTAYESPMFGDAFRSLRRDPDGSLKSSGKNTISVAGSTCTTAYSLTVRQAQN
jgi:hypothetical protein